MIEFIKSLFRGQDTALTIGKHRLVVDFDEVTGDAVAVRLGDISITVAGGTANAIADAARDAARIAAEVEQVGVNQKRVIEDARRLLGK